MKQFAILVTSVIFLAACSPTPAAPAENVVQTAIALTQEAAPTPTPSPTNTPEPTATPAPTETPTEIPIPQAFLTQLTNFLEKGSAVTGASRTGVSYVEFRRLIGEASGAYDLALSTWPDHVPTDAQEAFAKAMEGWDLNLYLWDLKINDRDNPVEPNVNRYQDFVDYAGDSLSFARHPSTFIVSQYRGKRYLIFDRNISILLTLSADHFDEGRNQALELLNR